MRKGIVLVWLCSLFFGVSYIFWQEELRYLLPTPVPENYAAVAMGDHIDAASQFGADGHRPLFLHFFNPECPCSRFNVPHFKALVNRYSDQIAFAVVVMRSESHHTESYIRDRFDLGSVPIHYDTTIAQLCGVYSTPQAVLLDSDNRLYYRGNYNKSRYCTDRKTNFAQMAIDSLLDGRIGMITDKAAVVSYGCTIPTCSK